MTQANQADLFGEGTYAAQRPNAPARATTPDGLFYVDTGQPTPLYYQRYNAIRGQGDSNAVDTTFNPAQANAASVAAGGRASNYQFDAERGLYYTQERSGRRVYIGNDPARSQEVANTPIFTVNQGQNAPQSYVPALTGAGMGAAIGARAGGPAGAAVGAGIGGLMGLPQAQGTPLYLSAGQGLPGFPDQRVGTQAEANQGNANRAATGQSTPAGGWAPARPTQPQQPQVPNMATYTPNMGTNGGSALSSEAQRILQQASQMSTQNQARADSFYSQAASAANRAAPQMTAPSSADMQAVYNRAMNFQADTSGANRLENMQMDMQGINNLESWSPQYSMQGVQNLESFNPTNTLAGMNALSAYNPDATYRSANQLENWQATNTLEGANAVAGFRPEMVLQDAQALRNFRADRSGIDRLNAYADEAQGPSAAQAMLRGQADADKRTQLAMARSGRGGPAAQVAAQRQAMSEGSLIEAETRGQAAVLSAQETDAYKTRQLQALAQAGSLIGTAEAQRLQAMAAAGQLMSQADQQKLQAVAAYGQLKAEADAQQLSARQAGGQLNANADNMVLGAKTAAGQLGANADSQILNARTNAAQLRGQMDTQSLSAIGQAAGLRTQQDSIRSQNLQAAGNIRIQGSGQNLQALSLAGQISSEIRSQDIGVQRSNLDATLQTMGLNDQQVRFFTQMGSDRELSNQTMLQNANQLGISAQQAQQAMDLAWGQFGYQQLSDQQQMQFNYAQLGQQQRQFDTNAALASQQQQYVQQQQQRQNNRQDRNDLLLGLGAAFTGFSSLFPTSQASAAGGMPAPVGGAVQAMNMMGQATGAPSGQLPVGTNDMGMVFDPYTNQWVYPSGAQGVGGGGQVYAPPAGGGGTTFGI